MAAPKTWTETEIKNLITIVEQAPTASAGIKMAAKKLGKTVGATQNKYYTIKRPAAKRKPAKRAAAQRVQTTRVATIRAPKNGRIDLSDMRLADLIALAQDVKSELSKRQSELSEAMKLLG